VTSRHGGLIEAVPNAVSIHSIKKNAYATKLNKPGAEYSLVDHFNYVRAGAAGWSVHHGELLAHATACRRLAHGFRAPQEFGAPGTPRHERAQLRFAASLAGYSLVCYLLQVKDRYAAHRRVGRLRRSTPDALGAGWPALRPGCAATTATSCWTARAT